MPNQFLNEIGKPNVTDVASRGSAAEQELVAAAKSGDESAFEILVKRHERKIFLVAFRYTRVREPKRVEVMAWRRRISQHVLGEIAC